MKKLDAIKALIAVFITIPIWFYLLHSILVAINATDLQFFLFWVYVPFSLLTHTLIRYIGLAKNE